jgi:thymidylate synthase
VYGKQWRDWTANPNHTWGVDQIANLINDLKTNPDSRRLMVSAWNVGELDSMVLPPCHYGFQVYTRELSLTERYELTGIFGKEKLPGEPSYTEEQQHSLLDELVPKRAISLMYNARSQDVPLGTPFNISSYALLLEIIAKMVNMVPDELISNMGDCHVYLNQIDGIKEQLTREPFELPKLVISNQVYFNEGIDEFLNSCLITDFQIEGYQSHPTIKFPLSN